MTDNFDDIINDPEAIAKIVAKEIQEVAGTLKSRRTTRH